MKRLSGWDAVLLYSETPNVHMHTDKVAVVELQDSSAEFGVDQFREVIRGRLYKLDPFRYQLVDIPFKFHHPMWRENCDVDLDYHICPWRVSEPGGRRELDEAIGEIASTPLDRSRPFWEMYFVEGQAGPSERQSFATEPEPSRSELIRSAFVDHFRQVARLPRVMKYTSDGMVRVLRRHHKISSNLTRPFTPPPSFINHMLTPERRFATAVLALTDIRETSRRLGVTINDLVLAISAGALRKLLLHCDGAADHALLASVPVRPRSSDSPVHVYDYPYQKGRG